jgi:2-C-methyl-D-erythritol 4-phosphate cytidylyltransferase
MMSVACFDELLGLRGGNIVKQDSCFTIWNRTAVSQHETGQLFRNMKQDSCFTIWNRTAVWHYETGQLFHNMKQDSCLTLWNRTAVSQYETGHLWTVSQYFRLLNQAIHRKK